jgi:hypothetical protein
MNSSPNPERVSAKQADREARALACDPFAGDYGGSGSGDRVLSDKIVTARKGGECHCCAQEVQPGTRVRSRAEVYDNELMSFRWCAICTGFMGFKFPWLADRAIEKRVAMRDAAKAGVL